MSTLKINYETYPLVVGSSDKYEFRDWDRCGSSVGLMAYYEEEDGEKTPAEVTWMSTVEENVVVSQEGVARALRTGYSRVIATDQAGTSVGCDIVVIDNYNRTTAQLIRLNAKNLILSQGEAFQLVAYIFPEDYFDNGALNTKVLWGSDDPEVVLADANGVLYARKPGQARITAKTADVGRTAVCMVQVNEAVEEEPESDIDVTGLSTKGNPYLYNVHICRETITQDSVNILWNRLSWIDLEQGCHYEVCCHESGMEGKELRRTTDMLGDTIDGLKPSTAYEVSIRAIAEDGTELAAEKLAFHTRKKENVCLNVCDAPYCAIGDGVTMDTEAIQQAINECPAGGTVYLPPHKVFLTGALFLKSNMTFRVDGILLGSTYARDYPRIISRWEGWKKDDIPAKEWANTSPEYPDNTKTHASLLNLGVYEEGIPGEEVWPVHVFHTLICGSGMINANGFKLAYTEGPNHHPGNGGQPEPISPVTNPNTRGCTIQMKNARQVYVKDLVIAYAPGWTIHTIFSDRITFDNLKVVTMGTGSIAEKGRIRLLNGDGIDPDSSTNVNIFHCDFTTGDDAIAIKSGRNREGNELAKPAKHIRITDCYFHDCLHGLAVGSEIAAGVSDLLVQNLKAVDMMYYSIFIKTMLARGGLTSGLIIRDCEFENVRHGINIEFGIPGKQHGLTINPALEPARMQNMLFENIRIRKPRMSAVNVRGCKESIVRDVTLRHVITEELDGQERLTVEYGENIQDLENLPFSFFQNVSCNPSFCNLGDL